MKHRFMIAIAALLLVQGMALALPANVYAQTPPVGTPGGTPAPTQPDTASQCTNFEESKAAAFGGNSSQTNSDGSTSTFFTNPNGSVTTTVTNPDGTVRSTETSQAGLLTAIYNNIKTIVNDSTERLYNSFIDNPAYQSAVFGAMTLMIIIFGVGFVIGVIQPSFGQVLVRLVKFGIIVALISPGGWQFFSDYMVRFFNDGTDSLVKSVMYIGTGVPVPADASPFFQFDRLAAFIIQPDTIIAIMGSLFAGGPYGMMMGGLMIFALMGFVGLLVTALRIYAVSYVARALLLGLAPVFFIFLLFEKTKQLFMTWVNALLSLMLQPILLFTFLSFFIILIESASKDMLSTEFCWTEYRNEEGTTNKRSFWRPVDQQTGSPIMSPQTWRGTFDCVVRGESTCPEFPMNIIDLLSFLILVYLAQRFARVIERIANELANTYIALDTGGRFDQFLSSTRGSSATRDALNPTKVRPQPQPAAPPPAQPQPGTGRTTPGG